jgi:hypothetical protein
MAAGFILLGSGSGVETVPALLQAASTTMAESKSVVFT